MTLYIKIKQHLMSLVNTLVVFIKIYLLLARVQTLNLLYFFKVVVIGLLLYPIAHYGLRAPSDVEPTPTINVTKVVARRVVLPQPACAVSHRRLLTEMLDIFCTRRTTCSPEDFLDVEKHKVCLDNFD